MAKNYFEDLYIPAKSGIYILGQTAFNPETEQKYYMIKVGLASDLYVRLKQYACYNPCFWIIDAIPIEKGYHEIEEKCHSILEILEFGAISWYNQQIETCCHSHSTEWYSVTEDTYHIICTYGYYAFTSFNNFRQRSNCKFTDKNFYKEWEKAIKKYNKNPLDKVING